MVDAKILLGKILQRFQDRSVSQVVGYNRFGYVRETNQSVIVTREDGQNTPIPFSKMIIGIEAYQNNPDLYLEGPNVLRDFGITRVNSPVWSLLHLLDKSDYC